MSGMIMAIEQCRMHKDKYTVTEERRGGAMIGWMKDLKDIYNGFKWSLAKGLHWKPGRWTDSVPVPVLILLGQFYY